MIINNGTIREAFQSFNTVFNKAFQEMEAQYPRVAMEVPSETRDESYAWLGAVPSMREWIGDREIKNLSSYGYTIRNKDFEMTVSVPRNDLEDDCIGVYKPMFQDLAYVPRSGLQRPEAPGQAGVWPVPQILHREVLRRQALYQR